MLDLWQKYLKEGAVKILTNLLKISKDSNLVNREQLFFDILTIYGTYSRRARLKELSEPRERTKGPNICLTIDINFKYSTFSLVFLKLCLISTYRVRQKLVHMGQKNLGGRGHLMSKINKIFFTPNLMLSFLRKYCFSPKHGFNKKTFMISYLLPKSVYSFLWQDALFLY